jgi:two-component system chemotaxis sensor kinase CheA
MDDLLAEFVIETAESLTELDAVLFTLEQTPDDLTTLARILRVLHTIKGTCGFLGLNRLEHIAHATEAVLSNMHEGRLSATADTVIAVLRGIDALKSILDGIKATGQEPVGDDSDLLTHLAAAAAGAAPPPPMMPPAERRQESRPVSAEGDTGAQTIRVGVTLLEELMTLVGELVLTRNQVLRIESADPKPELLVPLQRLSHITAELQEGVMKTRMQPIGAAWNKLPRMVRDLARELGKNIELTLLGAETELDRQVLELIRDPITHMVRNSADHGLESPTERRAYGKPDTGRITLKAYHEGGHIIIEVSDDGAGLRVDRIRTRALARGLATEPELASMPEADIQRFIFHPGFSTATTITPVSGRGVGMDVVKTNVERIGGTIDLRSVVGGGTHFTIKIPLTLAIIPALIVAAGDARFAIPQISVVELVRTWAHRRPGQVEPVIERIELSRMLRLREQLLPLVDLTELLQLRERAQAADHDPTYQDIVVVQIGASRFGLAVDQIYDSEEIVVKPVASILRQVSLFSGNTILGDGSVIMILDTNAIARLVGIGASGVSDVVAEPSADLAQSSADRTSMLVFRVGDGRSMAVPLGLVARLENLTAGQIEPTADGPVTQYRGRLMKLIPLSQTTPLAGAKRPVLVFSDHHRHVGLVVDEIVDVVEIRLNIELAADRAGVLGVAVIGDIATDVIDTAYWLTRAHPDWFGAPPRVSGGRARVLIVDDSDFFRQLLLPTLAADGYRVTAIGSGTQALRLREAGERFDAIVSDIEMPDMSGPEFARQVRGGGPWSGLPLIALTARTDHEAGEGHRHAGFNDIISKHDRPALLTCLRRHLGAASVDVMRAA